VFPATVQSLFDEAKTLERGRKGRALDQLRRPDPAGAVLKYREALAAVAALEVNEKEAAQQAFDAARAVHTAGGGRQQEDIQDRVAAAAQVVAKYNRRAERRSVVAKYTDRLVQCEALAAAASADAGRPTLDPALRAPGAFQYDIAAHPLAAAARRILQLPEDFDLGRLHDEYDALDVHSTEPPPICPAVLCALARDRKLPPSWRSLVGRRKHHIKLFRRSAEYADFIDAFRRFVRDVVVGIVGGDVAYQCPPTLRFHMPGQRPLGSRHKDSSYAGHTGNEINFWVPLTSVCGANSLFVESGPGKADFESLDLDYGALFRFDGENCEHHTVANSTGVTRVSLDFRVIPAKLYRNEFGDRIGSYPCEVSAERPDVGTRGAAGDWFLDALEKAESVTEATKAKAATAAVADALALVAEARVRAEREAQASREAAIEAARTASRPPAPAPAAEVAAATTSTPKPRRPRLVDYWATKKARAKAKKKAQEARAAAAAAAPAAVSE